MKPNIENVIKNIQEVLDSNTEERTPAERRKLKQIKKDMEAIANEESKAAFTPQDYIQLLMLLIELMK